jgi:hypothetical protein
LGRKPKPWRRWSPRGSCTWLTRASAWLPFIENLATWTPTPPEAELVLPLQAKRGRQWGRLDRSSDGHAEGPASAIATACEGQGMRKGFTWAEVPRCGSA